MARFGLALCVLVFFFSPGVLEAQPQMGLALRVSELEMDVSRLSDQVATLLAETQDLRTVLANHDTCSAKRKFFSPNDQAADLEGCVAALQANVPFDATVLERVTSDVFENPTELLILSAVAGSPTHLKVDTRCVTLGNNGFSSASITFLDSNGAAILGLRGCTNHGVSNGESTGVGTGKIVPIPEGAVAVELRTRLHGTIGGQDHNQALITVDVLGRP